jgi:hypothetical protein
VQQRFDTILRVSQAIVERQRHFLEHGEVAMRPLVLREIAETLSLHESTISRVTTQKYMATPRGTFELKYFFGSHVATDAGGAASSTAIRARDQAARRRRGCAGAAVGRAHAQGCSASMESVVARPHDCKVSRVPADYHT